MSRYEVELNDGEPPEQIARKLAEAMAYVHEHLAPAMVRFRGQPYVAIVPPDAGLAWSRAEESQRLSKIATQAAGIPGPPDPPGAGIEYRSRELGPE